MARAELRSWVDRWTRAIWYSRSGWRAVRRRERDGSSRRGSVAASGSRRAFGGAGFHTRCPETQAPRRIVVRRGDIMIPRGSGCAAFDGLGLALHRLGETLAEHPKLRQVFLGEVFVPVGQVQHRVVEPVLLVLRQRFDDA